MRNIKILLALALMPALNVNASVSTLLPTPKQIEATGGTISFVGNVNLTDNTDCVLLKEFFTSNNCTIGSTGLPVTVTKVSSIAGAYNYTLYGYDNEAYTLNITSSGINITAIDDVGVIRAAQTLYQLAEDMNGKLECVNIVDWPAFKLRGYMHDVGRSFITFEELEKEIELLSQFKVNTFHWHMTEHQAWRFQVNAYPQLTESKNMTRHAGYFYTQEQCKRLVALAKKYGMIVIPEIDMPGHSTAFTTAMGYDMQTSEGKTALLKILDEVAVVFEGCPYIHIGADEVAITDSSFLKTMTDKVHDLGFKAICWNPINNTTITSSTGFDMTQMWSTSGKKISGVPNIDCRYNYCNHFDVFADLVAIYKSNIYYTDKGNEEIAGSISAYWNDRVTPTQDDILKQNNFYANVLATAERCWKGGGKQYIEAGGSTLPNDGDEYEEFVDWEARFLYHKAHSLKNEPIGYVKQTNVKWLVTQGFPNSGNKDTVFPPEENIASSYTYDGNTYTTTPVTGAGIYLRHTWGGTVPGLYSNAAYNQTAYAYTYIYSKEARTVGAQIEFQNYGRSEKDRAPANGTWDYKGSKVFVNGAEIAPPTWDNAGVTITNEVELKNENFTARKPVQINLQAGWNTVLIKLPYISINSGIVRLNKWMFTFVLTDLEGNNALEDVVYSPTKTLDTRAENLVLLIQQIRSYISDNFKDEVGYYSLTTKAVVDLLADLDAAEENVYGSMADTQIESTYNALNAAFTSLKSSLSSCELAQPQVYAYYYLHTPLRDSRYMAESNNLLAGIESPDATAEWRFLSRGDGTYDICNYSTEHYISPITTSATQITTSVDKPDTGWQLRMSSTLGYVILTNGKIELNQTRGALNYAVYNWGYGSKDANDFRYDDTGCQIKVKATGRTDPAGVGKLAIDAEAVNPILSVKSGSVTLNDGVYATAYNLQGMVLAKGDNTLTLPKGPIIIVANGKSHKILVP